MEGLYTHNVTNIVVTTNYVLLCKYRVGYIKTTLYYNKGKNIPQGVTAKYNSFRIVPIYLIPFTTNVVQLGVTIFDSPQQFISQLGPW